MSAEEHDCPSPEELLNSTIQNIKKYGLQVLMVHGTDYSPKFAYSIGLFETYDHPEIICFGLSHDLSHHIINDIGELIKEGKHFKHGDISTEIFGNGKACFVNVDVRNIGDYLLHDIKYYGHSEFPALQLVWTDRNDKFPWEDGFQEEFRYRQPLLDRNADFKFREAKSMRAFTTKQWLKERKPIVRVAHDHDGEWQFLTDDELSTDDMAIVALSQLIESDKTLNEVFDLEYGELAEREYIGGPWIREKFEEKDEEDEI